MHDVSELAGSGGLRGRARAERAAEQLAAGIIAAIPPEYADALPGSGATSDPDDDDPGALAERIRERVRGDGPGHASDADDRQRVRDAVRQARDGD